MQKIQEIINMFKDKKFLPRHWSFGLLTSGSILTAIAQPALAGNKTKAAWSAVEICNLVGLSSVVAAALVILLGQIVMVITIYDNESLSKILQVTLVFVLISLVAFIVSFVIQLSELMF